MTDDPHTPTPADDPTVTGPATGGPARGETAGHGADGGRPRPGEPTPAEGARAEAAPADPTHDEPTLAAPPLDAPTIAAPTVGGWGAGGAGLDDGPTMPVGGEAVAVTGPPGGGWPYEDVAAPPVTELLRQPGAPAAPAKTTRSPAYYISLGAAVVLVVGLVGLAAFFSAVRPSRVLGGSPVAGQTLPEITAPSTVPSSPPPSAPAQDPVADVAGHPLSSSTARMGDVTCALPRFDLSDDRQAAFYQAAKTCADDAWRDVLQEAGLEGSVAVVTVTTTVQTRSCGELTPTSPATHCDGTVHMTPAHLRDTEQNGRYPGRYLGVFLREYAEALQFTTGLTALVGEVTTGSAEDLDERLAQQATCLAGVVSGAMAGRGAVDANITGEITARLSDVDAPPDAKAWLDKGSAERTPAACNTWAS